MFVGGENFGFIPIIFMSQDEAGTFLNDESGTQSFAKVVRKAKETGQVYSLESIVSEFVYELVVTARPTIVKENLDIKRIISYETFKEEANEGMSVDGAVYIDVGELDINMYNNLVRQDSDRLVRFFTLDGQIPEYIDSSKVIFL